MNEQQTRLDTFIHKHKGKRNFPGQGGVRIGSHEDSKRHDSSRQNSDTQPMQEFQKPKAGKYSHICYQLIMTGPYDTINGQMHRRNLKKVLDNYNKVHILEYLLDNLKYQGVKNLEVLNSVTDASFWKSTLKKMMQLVLNHGDQICSNIRTLLPNNPTKIASISRQQILIIMSCMFLGLMPSNQFCKTRSFGYFMTSTGSKEDLKLQKLLFLINYFKVATNLPKQTMDDIITIQRNSFKDSKIVYNSEEQIHIPMRSVLFGDQPHKMEEDTIKMQIQQQTILIQDYYGKAAMVDFANKSIGGGVLRNGCVQEQILFMIFPQAIASMMICNDMEEDQAIIFYGVRRYSNYKNYSYDLMFNGNYEGPHPVQVNDSVMIAIDAINFYEKGNTALQFNKSNIMRQLTKASAGLSGLQFLNKGDMSICTGRWGCGAFRGDQIWKFFIQWIVCSQYDHEMIYLTSETNIKRDLKLAVKYVMGKSVLEVLALMEAFSKFKTRLSMSNSNQQYTFIDYLKDTL